MTADDHPNGKPAARGRHTLAAQHLRLAYDQLEVVSNLSLEIPPGRVSAIVGANACGKSTLLRGLARLLKPKAGAVYLDGKSIHALPTRHVARRLMILPQSPTAPEGITVADLVARGRYPHQTWFRQWTAADEQAVAAAMAATEVVDLAARSVDELSGGQRQRVWIAMALAQDAPIMLLDEPTTFLDLAHQVEILDLLTDLNQRDQRTIVLVLHDLNHACRYSHHLIAMRGGTIVAQGPPAEVVTCGLVEEVFDLRCRVVPDPVSQTPMVIPIGRHLTASPGPAPAADAAASPTNGRPRRDDPRTARSRPPLPEKGTRREP
jgi:iron complex transport system ATP-binding protein